MSFQESKKNIGKNFMLNGHHAQIIAMDYKTIPSTYIIQLETAAEIHRPINEINLLLENKQELELAK